MHQDDPSNSTSKDGPSSQSILSGVRSWEERMLPFRQRGLTPLQRQQLAIVLRASREKRFREMRLQPTS